MKPLENPLCTPLPSEQAHPQSLVNLISTRVLGQSRSSSTKKGKPALKNFHSACLEIYSIFRVAANFLAPISSKKGNSPTPNSTNTGMHNNLIVAAMLQL